MTGEAVLSAFAFIGGNYLARYLSGDEPNAAQEEKVRHFKALEAYNTAYSKHQKDGAKLLDWIRMKDQAKQNFADTDYAFKLYNQTLTYTWLKSLPNLLLSRRFKQASQERPGEV